MMTEGSNREPTQHPHRSDRQGMVREFERLATIGVVVQGAYFVSAVAAAWFVVALLARLLFPAFVTVASPTPDALAIIVAVLPLWYVRRKVERKYQEAKRRLEES